MLRNDKFIWYNGKDHQIYGVYGEAWLTQLTVTQPRMGSNPIKRPIIIK